MPYMPLLNAVYAAASKECEETEVRVSAHGARINGHHMAQRIVEDVKVELNRRFSEAKDAV